MRDIKIIEAEIAKLQAEAEDVRMDASKKNAAVSILGNLGWTWSSKTGWKKPEVKLDVKLKDHKAPVKAGDLCEIFIDGKTSVVYVHTVNMNWSTVSDIYQVTRLGGQIDNRKYNVRTGDLIARPREYFIGKTLQLRF